MLIGGAKLLIIKKYCRFVAKNLNFRVKRITL